MKTIRLLAPVLVAHDQFPPGAVFDATDEIADMLIEGKDGVPCAELTYTAERYPLGQPLTAITAFPVFPGDRFPLPKEEGNPVGAREGDDDTERPAGEQLPGGTPRPRLVAGMFTTETDRRIEARIRAAGSAPVGVETRREVPAARIDQSTVQQDDRSEVAYDPLRGPYGHYDDQGNWVQAAQQPTKPAPAPRPAPPAPKPAPKPGPPPPKGAVQGKADDNEDDD